MAGSVTEELTLLLTAVAVWLVGIEITLMRMWVYSFSYLCVSRFVQPVLKYFLPVLCYYFSDFIA